MQLEPQQLEPEIPHEMKKGLLIPLEKEKELQNHLGAHDHDVKMLKQQAEKVSVG